MATNDDLSGENLLNDLHKWVSAEALKIDNIETYNLKIHGTDDKIEHYESDIAFVDISAENFNGEKREYNLVIKYGQKTQAVREKLPIRYAFEREIDIYSKLIPCYHRFQEKRNLPLFIYAPKCYLTKFTDMEEVIILENLKQMGYIIHDRKIPMDINHIKLVLEVYAEWHALSFALEDQEDEEYLGITKSWAKQPWNRFIESESGEMIDLSLQYLYGILEKSGAVELLQKYKEKIGNIDARMALLDLLNKQEPKSVVLHGDCWNNNFLFKYEDSESTEPRCMKVALLDFQMSSVRSPVFDLAHFIYAVASEKELKHFKELIEHYYIHLSKNIKRLGCDPDKLFTYSDLTHHWEKYSAYGAILNPLVMAFALVEKESNQDFKRRNVLEIIKMTVHTEEYKRRVVAIAKHFVENIF